MLRGTLLFTLLWAAVTYPQVLRMQDGVNDVGDPLLNTWAMAWVAHQLPFAPAHLFDGNIFHPERRTLAYSETLLAPALASAPMLWLGAGPILVYNLLLLAAFVLSGVGTALLVRELTGSGAAGLVAGAIFAFLPYRFDHYAHFQLQQTQWMPLALWAFHRLLKDGRTRYGVVLGVAVGGQALSSVYNALFLGTYLVVVGVLLLLCDWRAGGARLRGLGVAIVLATLMALPVALAHMRAHDVVGERSRADVLDGSAAWTDFLAAPPSSLIHGAWSQAFGRSEHRLFPGVLGLALTLVALWPPWSPTRLAYAAGLLLTIDMARGFHGWTYGWAYDHLFVFRSLRIPARAAIMTGLSIAVLGGFGVARILAWLRMGTSRTVVTCVLLAGVLLESWVAPLGLTTIPTELPATYADLLADKGEGPRSSIIRRQSDAPPVVVVEFPINQEDTRFMHYSTFHWQTLINGYSGFFSERYVQLGEQLKGFPRHAALEDLARLQTRYVVVHGELMSPDAYRQLIDALDGLTPQFRLVSRRQWQGGEISLYAFRFFAKE